MKLAAKWDKKQMLCLEKKGKKQIIIFKTSFQKSKQPNV